MKLSNEKFREIYERISYNSFQFMKKQVLKELQLLKKLHKNEIDKNTITNIILTSLALMDGNMILTCRNFFKDVDMNRLLKAHTNIIENLINKTIVNDKMN